MSNQSFNRNLRNEPDISVVVPTRDRPLMLKEALASVSAQRGVRFEVIVVNDGGCDISDMLSDFNDQLDLHYISLPPNSGLPAARNAGIRRASASHLAYLDDDDLYLPNHLARLADRLDSKPEVGLVYSDAWLLKQQRDDDRYRTVGQLVLARDYDRARMLRDSFIAPSAMMHRRECVERVGGFDEQMRWCYEDWDFLLRIDALYRIERVAGASVAIRLREDSSNMSSEIRPERIRAARLLQQRYGVEEIQPKTFWEVAESLSRQGD
jgi:glycosyltransferase involved in cell wall biosynthesis